MPRLFKLSENLVNMNIACITYREWATRIYNQLFDKYKNEHKFLLVSSKEEFNKKELIEFNPNIILWYGWSWIVDEYFTEKYISVMLHPSPLPKYRGGSPIQNQIINGERQSAVSLFKMTKNLDDGDIFFQDKFSLEGSLNDIFNRIIDLGIKGTINILEGNYKLKQQDHSKATYTKRREPKESEITLDELKNKSSTYLYNKIRMLNDPYPNAYIITSDKKKLFITKSKIE